MLRTWSRADWDELLRLAGSLKLGHSTPRRWSASFPRQVGRTSWPLR
ncbi:transposase [Nonomuraea antri]|nr:transposase [Nonomuraea antri]